MSGQISIKEVIFSTIHRSDIQVDQLVDCSILFSKYYGFWDDSEYNFVKIRNKPIKLSGDMLKKLYLFDDSCGVSLAKINGETIGHAFYCLFDVPIIGEVLWVTQLVVNEKYRRLKLAQNIIKICIKSTTKVCCIVTANPYSVKSLEKAFNIECKSAIICKFKNMLIHSCNISYIKNYNPLATKNKCLINTKFHINRLGANEPVKKLILLNEWNLGNFEPGCEFFALAYKQARKIHIDAKNSLKPC